MIITTTAGIEGYRIVRHLGPVSIHMVAGTNLFSDFFASVTDMFGGTSGSYGRQLSALYARSTKLLEEEARRKGANAVVGLAIDFDELSAQGKSMFMLNALGTAVRVVPADRPASNSAEELDAEAISRALRRRSIIRDLANGSLAVTEELWDFATSERIEEFTRIAVGAVARAEESSSLRAAEIEKARAYFGALGPDAAAKRLFPYLAPHDKLAPSTRTAVAVLIRELHLMDYVRLLSLLESEDTEAARRALQVATASRQSYEPDDIERIRVVRDRIQTRFVPRWQPARVKGLFGKEHSAWSCPCGGTPGADDTHCPKCQRDTRGLAVRDVTPEQAAEYLEELLEVLAGAVRPTGAVSP